MDIACARIIQKIFRMDNSLLATIPGVYSMTNAMRDEGSLE